MGELAEVLLTRGVSFSTSSSFLETDASYSVTVQNMDFLDSGKTEGKSVPSQSV